MSRSLLIPNADPSCFQDRTAGNKHNNISVVFRVGGEEAAELERKNNKELTHAGHATFPREYL